MQPDFVHWINQFRLANLISLIGWPVMVLFAWAISYNRKLFPWRTVVWGLGLQFTLALLILKTPWGEDFSCSPAKLSKNSSSFPTKAANSFSARLRTVICSRKIWAGEFRHFRHSRHGHDHHCRRHFVAVVSLGRFAKSRPCRRLGDAQDHANERKRNAFRLREYFHGQTEAPLMIRPYVPRMTRSEIMTIMVCGMAHIAGGVAAVYAAMGMRAGYPNTAGHLLTASVLNCPAALMIAKILLPETQQSETAATMPATVPRTTANSIDAICRGAGDGFQLSLNVIAMLIAFIAMIALANYIVTWPQIHMNATHPATLQNIFGWVNAPFAFLMGVPMQDCLSVGQILGERIVLNEFVGYLDLTTNAKTLALDRAVSRLQLMRCAASRIFPASPSRSAASARLHRNAAVKWPKSVFAR